MSVERQFVTNLYDQKIVRANEEDAVEIDWINKRVQRIASVLSDIDQWIYLRESKSLTSLEGAHKDAFSPMTRLSGTDRHFVASALLVCSKTELIQELIEVLKEAHHLNSEVVKEDFPEIFDRD